MSAEESGAVHTRMRVVVVGDQVVWIWTLGECSVSLSLPNVEPMADETFRDLGFLVDNLGELVNTGVVEAQVQLFAQELEEDLDELSAEEG